MKNNPSPDLLPVILAGGCGTRLWPLSRAHYAKQFLAFFDDTTLLQATVGRLQTLPHLPVLLLCHEDTRFLAAEQMRQMGDMAYKLLLEPEGRNTAPATALAALQAMADGADPVLLVMPADHLITDTEAFGQAARAGTKLALEGHMVTFGITPDHAATGYGYILRGAEMGAAFKVEAFIEKPAPEKAQSLINDPAYFWNSGIFMFRASRYLEELGKFRPDIMAACRTAFAGKQEDMDFLRFDRAAFLNCPDDSIDYAVMENTKNAVMLPLCTPWNDIGSWAALWDVSAKDAHGNCEIGDVTSLDGQGNYIRADSRLVAALGCEDMVIVETKDSVMVAPKAKVQDLKKLVAKLKDNQRAEVDNHREVYRPWGKYDTVAAGVRFQVKRITVKPGGKLSVQKHHHRAEHWVVVQGTALVYRGSETILLSENESTYIPLGEVHALENPGKLPLELIEIQSGSYLGEDDIIRYEDRYGRR